MFLKLFFSKVLDFSKQNWWIYFVLVICLGFVYKTWFWSITEIIILFLVIFLGNLFIMIMQDYYTSWNNKYWAINQIISVIIFTLVSIYSYYYKWQYQYLIWQDMYILAAINSVLFFVFKRDLKRYFNEYSFLTINILLLFVFIMYIPHQNSSILQAIGFSLITSWLVSVKDKVRYWLNVFWIALLFSWSLWGAINSYLTWDLNWIDLGYFLLTWTVFIFYLKLLPRYLIWNGKS